MPLTYRPFENVPTIEELGNNLRKNVTDPERMMSALSGAQMIFKGLSRKGLARWALLGMGVALVRRGWTGHCPLYEQIEVSHRRVHGRG